MRPLLLMLCTLASTHLLADEISAKAARITKVTVYADRAEVVRTLTTDLKPGEHTLLFEDLPGETDLSSVRANGSGALTLLDIRTDKIQTAEITDEQIRKLSDELKSGKVRLQELVQRRARNSSRRASLDKVLGRLTATVEGAAQPDLDPGKWSAYLSYHLEALATLDREILELKVAEGTAKDDIGRMERELGRMNGGRSRSRNVTRVNVEVSRPGSVEVELSYVVIGPGWSPRYDLRADTSDGKLTVNYQALVSQRTGEDWKGVDLRLSTAQPGVGGREPQLTLWAVGKAQPVEDFKQGNRRKLAVADEQAQSVWFARDGAETGKLQRGSESFSVMAVAGRAEVRMARPTAAVKAGATAALFTIQRKCDIPSDPRQIKVDIGEATFDATFRHSCSPRLSPAVYLKTTTVNTSEFPFLAGPASVFLDGSYVAASSMDTVPAGQEFTTFLGSDQAVKVERKALALRDEHGGLFGGAVLRSVHDHLFKITNGRRQEIDLSINDQLPISAHEDIKVVLQEPAYEKDTDGLKIDDQKFIEWRLRIPAGEKREIPFRFAVERPEGTLVISR